MDELLSLCWRRRSRSVESEVELSSMMGSCSWKKIGVSIPPSGAGVGDALERSQAGGGCSCGGVEH